LSRALFASAHAVRAFHARTAAFNANNSNNSSTASFSTVVAAEPGQQQQEQQQQQQDDGSNNKSSGGQSSSSSSSSSSTSFNPFSWFWLQCRLAFDWYARMLDLYPVRTQSLTSGSLFLVGDLTAQRYERGLDASKGIDVSDRPHIDWLRLAACTSFGLFVLGPCGNFWYSWLDRFTNRLAKPLSWKNVGVKVLLDTAIFNPIFLVVFFTTVSLLEGLTINDIGRKLYRDFVPSYAVDCSIWPPIQTINFRLVPVKFQLLVVNLGCYFDDVFLSYVQHNGMPAIFQRVERWWLEYIGDDGLAHGHGHGHGHKAVKPAAEEGAQVGEAESAVPLVEVLPHPPSSSADAATVVLVPSSEAHPHHAHVHPPRRRADPSEAPLAPQPHHHVVPRVLAEDQVVWRLPRARGVDVQLVEELDADWTDVPASEEDKKRAGIAAANKKKTQQPQTPPKRD
jgi:protein Mpv17